MTKNCIFKKKYMSSLSFLIVLLISYDINQLISFEKKYPIEFFKLHVSEKLVGVLKSVLSAKGKLTKRFIQESPFKFV